MADHATQREADTHIGDTRQVDIVQVFGLRLTLRDRFLPALKFLLVLPHELAE